MFRKSQSPATCTVKSIQLINSSVLRCQTLITHNFLESSSLFLHVVLLETSPLTVKLLKLNYTRYAINDFNHY